jgi:hypothetical protein
MIESVAQKNAKQKKADIPMQTKLVKHVFRLPKNV